MRDSKRGSALIVVIMVVIGLAIVVASLLRSSGTEMKVNRRNIMLHEARNAAEALQEYATAMIIEEFKDNPSLSGSALKGLVNSIPTSATSHFAGTHVDLSGSSIDVGDLGSSTVRYVPEDKDTDDPLGGKHVFSRTTTVLTKAKLTAGGPGGGTVYGYASQLFELRDAPLFTHAIFFNMDLMVAPSPNMAVYGPVHTNGNMGVTSNNDLHFHGKVTVGGNFYVGHKMSSWAFHSSGYDAHGVAFEDDQGTLQNVQLSGSSTSDATSYFDSRHADWTADALSRWGGMVTDTSHSVPILNPISIPDYQPDDTSTSAYDPYNPAYALIEPLLPTGHADRKSAETRLEKMAMKAGLLLKVEKSGSTYSVRAFMQTKLGSNDLLPLLNVDGNPTLEEIDLPAGLIGDANAEMTDIETDGSPELYQYDSSASKVVGGWYDRRHRQQLDILSLDIGVLKHLVENETTWDDVVGAGNDPYEPDFDWNGIVYVEFPLAADSAGSADNIVKADVEPSAKGTSSTITPGIALALIDCGNLPAPSFLPSTRRGFTLATNAALYVVGDYNADGNATASDSASTAEVDEVPAALLADSITLLSDAWSTSVGGNPIGRENSATDDKNDNGGRYASDTEYAMGMICGYIPADPATDSTTRNWGGGVQNLPRFLENWSNKTATIRGSLVALFESEVQTFPFLVKPTTDVGNHSGSWFSPPIRNWGFSSLFAANKMPPGIPSVRHPRLSNLSFLSKAEYDAALAGL